MYVASVADPAQSFVVPGVGYGAVSAYRPLSPGTYVISMRGAGAAADSPAVISTSLDARPGGAYTVAGVGMSAELGLSVLTDKLQTPAAGKASVRVINGAASAPSVDVGPANGQAWAGPVEFGTDTQYVDVPLGTWNLKVSAPGRPDLTTPCQLDANSVYTVLLVDRGGSLTAELLTDSAGSKVVPAGGVNAGYGGAADAHRRRPDVAGRRSDRDRGRRVGTGRPGRVGPESGPWSVGPRARPGPDPPGPEPHGTRRRAGRARRGAGPDRAGLAVRADHRAAGAGPADRSAVAVRRPAAPPRRRPASRPGGRRSGRPAARHRSGHPEAGHPREPARAGRGRDRCAAAAGRTGRGRLVQPARPRPASRDRR